MQQISQTKFDCSMLSDSEFFSRPFLVLWMSHAFIAVVTVQPGTLSPRFTGFSCVVLVLVLVS